MSQPDRSSSASHKYWVNRSGYRERRLTINYRSSRTEGYARNYTLDIQLTKETWPASLREIRVFIYIAGQSFEEVFTDLSANMRHSFTWDGKDAYGREVYGSQPVTVLLAYMYEVLLLTCLPHGRSPKLLF